MNDFCEMHNTQMFKKDGPYGAYWSHIVADEGFCNGERIKPFKNSAGESRASGLADQARSLASRQETREKLPEPDWEAISRGKVRCQVFTAVVKQAGIEQALKSLTQIEEGVSYIMDGPPSEQE